MVETKEGIFDTIFFVVSLGAVIFVLGIIGYAVFLRVLSA